MTRQKSEDCIKPQGRRKPVETQGIESPGGGEAVPVEQQPRQLVLRFETAEQYAKAEADGARDTHRRVSRTELMRVRRATAPGSNNLPVNEAVEFMQELGARVSALTTSLL
jgi:hypothetical protein